MLTRCNTLKQTRYIAPHIVSFNVTSSFSSSSSSIAPGPLCLYCVRIGQEQDRHSSLDFAPHFKEFFGGLPAVLRSKYSLAIRIYRFISSRWHLNVYHRWFEELFRSAENELWTTISKIYQFSTEIEYVNNSNDGRSEWCVERETQTIASKYAWMTL